MGNRGFYGLIMRVLAMLGGLVFLVVFVRVLLAMLRPILPPAVIGFMAAGGKLLYSIVAPALPGAAALALLFAIWWVVTGRGR